MLYVLTFFFIGNTLTLLIDSFSQNLYIFHKIFYQLLYIHDSSIYPHICIFVRLKLDCNVDSSGSRVLELRHKWNKIANLI